METIKIAGVKRADFGKKESKHIRKEGMIPCTIYGRGETVHFSVDAKAVKPLIYTPQSYLVEFDIEGQKEVGVMREVQYHPVKDNVLHIDFYHVSSRQTDLDRRSGAPDRQLGRCKAGR